MPLSGGLDEIMNKSRLFFLLVIIVGTAGLLLKIFGGSGRTTRQADAAFYSKTQDYLLALRQQGLAVSLVPQPDNPIMLASGDDCDLALVLADPRGYHRAVIDQLIEPGDKLGFVFQGNTVGEDPGMQSWLAYYTWSFATELGIERPFPYLTYAIERGDCSIRIDVETAKPSTYPLGSDQTGA